jgi:hypothetical protein
VLAGDANNLAMRTIAPLSVDEAREGFMGSSVPIVGREKDLEFLMGTMSSAISGSLVLIAGEAGSGKTTLCEESERMAAQSGCLVLVGRCVHGPHTPYFPFIEALHGRAADPSRHPTPPTKAGGCCRPSSAPSRSSRKDVR